MTLIPAAVVGVGYLGKFHADKYAALEGANLRAVVDTDERRAQEIAAKHGSEAVTDYKRLPEFGIRAASVVSTTSSHFDIASYLLSNGIDVLVEKPMTVSIQQGEKLIALAKEKGRILQVGHLERFNPAFRAIKDSLTNPMFFEVRRISPFSGRGHDVDVVLDLMIHDIDIVAHLVGRPLEKVEALGVPVLTKSFDIANARLSFEGGAVANVTASRAAFKSERTLRVFQPRVYVSLDYGKKQLKVYRQELAEEGRLPTINVEEHQVEERDALQDEISSFIQAVRDQKAPEVTGEDGLLALRVAERIRHAMQEQNAKYTDYEAKVFESLARGFDTGAQENDAP